MLVTNNATDFSASLEVKPYTPDSSHDDTHTAGPGMLASHVRNFDSETTLPAEP